MDFVKYMAVHVLKAAGWNCSSVDAVCTQVVELASNKFLLNVTATLVSETLPRNYLGPQVITTP